MEILIFCAVYATEYIFYGNRFLQFVFFYIQSFHYITIVSDCGGMTKTSEGNSKPSQLPIRIKVNTEYENGAFSYAVFCGKSSQIKIFHKKLNKETYHKYWKGIHFL